MLIPRVMPCLLLRNGALVKTVQFSSPSYVGDPINAVRIYNEKEVDELIFLDISATPEGRRPPFDVIGEIAGECFMPVTYGGGVGSIEDITTIFSLGIEKVAINTRAIEDRDFVTRAAERFGSQAIVVSIDVKKRRFGRYEVFTRCGKRPTGLEPVMYAADLAKRGAGEILLTSIDLDGTQSGYDVELISAVSHAVDIPVIACGGAGRVSDFRRAVQEGGASACATGSMVVYFGRNRAVLINFPERKELEAVFA
jgi:cyclase